MVQSSKAKVESAVPMQRQYSVHGLNLMHIDWQSHRSGRKRAQVEPMPKCPISMCLPLFYVDLVSASSTLFGLNGFLINAVFVQRKR
mgnify:CR=1 FL=1